MKNLKKIILMITVLVMAFAMTACSVDPSDDGSDTETITVYMNIDFPDADDEDDDAEAAEDIVYPEDIEDYKMQVENGATVMQILESFASQNNMEIVVDSTSPTVYVTSIAGVAESTGINASGWIYEVNDKSSNEEAAKYVPENGDEITWEFIKF